MKWAVVALVGTGMVFVAMQGWRPQLPSAGSLKEPDWDRPGTRELARRACFDCHSSSSRFPWYHQIQPIRYLLDRHIREAREALNFQSVDGLEDGEDIARQIETKRMPLPTYLWMHPEARLSDQERQELANGMKRTYP